MNTESTSTTQSRLQEELRGIIRGDARCDDLTLQLFSSDGSPYCERPLGVVWPRGEQDVAAVVQYASEIGASIHVRGSGTSGSAAAIGSGIVLDFSRYMRRTVASGDDFVRVQPGVIRERVNEILRRDHGSFFGPSSGHVPTGTIGGILAVDNIGPRWLRYGSPHESVLELEVVSAAGERWNLRPYRANNEVLGPYFRRRFLNAAAAEANASAETQGTSPVVPEFDDEASAASKTSEALYYGLDYNDGYGARSFRSDFVREDFFRRAFGENARAVRELVAKQPWANALKAIRRYERYLDAEQGTGRPLRCGYALRDVVRDGFDPTRFFVGSEGTLGVIVEAKLTTFPLSRANCAAILLFDSIDKATLAVPDILRYQPTLCDLLDSRVVSLTRAWDTRFESVLPQTAEAALVVEFDSDSESELHARLSDLAAASRYKLGSFGIRTAFLPEERLLCRDLLRKASCARLRMSANFQPFPFWDDAGVPVEAVPSFLRDAQNLFKREHIVYSVWGNVGVGQLSIQPIIPYSDEEERRAFALSDEYEDLVLSYGGEVGVAKGNGRLRTAALPKRFPELYKAFVEVKDAFDPDNRLNPDCVVSPEMRRMKEFPTPPTELRSRRRFAESLNEDPSSDSASDPTPDFGDYLAPETDAMLRESSLISRTIRQRAPFDLARLEHDKQIDWFNRSTRSQLECQLAWNPTSIYAPTYQCVGCGHCRIRTAETRMCPAFRTSPDEYASCRAKANLLRGALDGDLELAVLTQEFAHSIASRCVRCHCCTYECPAQVDVPRLTFRLTSAYRAAVGLGFADLFAVRANAMFNFLSFFAPQLRKAFADPAFRWLLEKVLGVAQSRALPAMEDKPYLRMLAKTKKKRRFEEQEDDLETLMPDIETPTPEDGEEADGEAAGVLRVHTAGKKKWRKAALFIDSFANFFDVDLVDVTLKILERNGVKAFVPMRPQHSGTVAFAMGDLDRSEQFATRNIAAFTEIMRDGVQILCLEPISAVCIRKEYPYFCDDQDARQVYENVTDVFTYLDRLQRDGEFDAQSLRAIDDAEKTHIVGYHAPCRSLALAEASPLDTTPAERLLSLIPGVHIKRLEQGCCGFSGYSGFTKRRFSDSVRIGAKLLFAARAPEIDMCVSECSFCNMQLTQSGAKPVVHALKLLGVSYGFISLDSSWLKTIRKRTDER